ncbi:MAG: SphA family protein [Rhizobiaceae bacterium]
MGKSIPRSLAALAALAGMTVAPQPLLAVEGGTSAYLLGSRDSFAGIVPGPGTYVGVDFVTFSGDITGVSLGGLPIRAEVEVDVNLVKFSATQVFEGSFWGGTPAININIPILHAGISFTPQPPFPPALTGRRLKDETSGFGDITITPMLGWHDDKLHYSAALSVFVPTGEYSTATVDIVPPVGIDALSNGKNVWSFQPVLSATHFDPESGLEFSAATSLLFSTINKATDYQTAPAFTLEASMLQHLPSGFAFGVTGYAYQQLADDSGSGAAGTRAALGATSLRAHALAVGPILTYSGKVGQQPVSFKFKYYKEFEVRRRFKSDVLWFNASTSF